MVEQESAGGFEALNRTLKSYLRNCYMQSLFDAGIMAQQDPHAANSSVEMLEKYIAP